jgi:dihydroxyacetone kinase-like protein
MNASIGVDELQSWLREFVNLVAMNEDPVTKLDSVIGDGDHGENLRRGMSAYQDDRSLGHPDAGATSAALPFDAAANTLA